MFIEEMNNNIAIPRAWYSEVDRYFLENGFEKEKTSRYEGWQVQYPHC